MLDDDGIGENADRTAHGIECVGMQIERTSFFDTTLIAGQKVELIPWRVEVNVEPHAVAVASPRFAARLPRHRETSIPEVLPGHADRDVVEDCAACRTGCRQRERLAGGRGTNHPRAAVLDAVPVHPRYDLHTDHISDAIPTSWQPVGGHPAQRVLDPRLCGET